MADDNESLDSFEPEDPNYKLENPKYILAILKEYHEQAVEDCRIIGNQKYNVLVSLSIALGSSIYALSQVYNSTTGTNLNYTLVGTLKTSYTNIPNVLSLLGNTSSIQPVWSNFESFPPLTKFIFIMIMISLLLFVLIILITIITFFFLMLHLDLMTQISIKIEGLQRDILFKKMGNVDLFSWNELKQNDYSRNESLLSFGTKKETLIDYLKQKFVLEDIKDVTTSVIDDQIKIEIVRQIKKFGKKEIKSGILSLDKVKGLSILTVDGIEIDRFNAKEDNGDYILYESELKYRFRNIMPHSTIFKPSYSMNLKLIFIITAFYLLSEAVLQHYLS